MPPLSIATQPRPETLHERARNAWSRGDAVEAFRLLRDAVALSVDLELLNDFAVVAVEALGVEAARDILGTVLAVEPERADATQNLAVLNWRGSETLGGPDAGMPERAFPGMPNGKVMAEHARRYAFALDHVQGARVLDLGCGTGYGSELLTWGAASVQGFDLWQPAAHETPSWPGGAQLTWGHDLCSDPLPAADVAVAFEVLEHLADGPAALRLAWQAARRLVVSFPNPTYHGSHHNPYHVNDWPLDEVEAQLRAAAPTGHVELEHFHQGADGLIRPGRDPEASYWLLVATAVPTPVAAPAPLSVPIAGDNRMKRDWDERARENAMHYIQSGRETWDEDAFSASGRMNVENQVLSDAGLIFGGRDPKTLRALEIGCGIGRMSEHLAGVFGSLTGVDVSGEMIRGATERLGHLPNATFVETDGASLPFPDASFDFVLSFIVFQHVPTKEAVIGTLRDAYRVLAPGGLCKFQVQGSQNPHYLAAQKDTWLGVTFSEAEMAAIAAELGFQVLKSDGADSQYYWHWWRKPAAPEPTPEPARTRGVVVLGCGRSGTSAVTRGLNLLGLPLGADDDLLQPQADNPRGFWESRALLKVNDEVLETLGGAWHTPPARQPWPVLDSLRSRAREAFAAVYGDGPWLWKDPRTTLTFPFWVDALELEPALVLVHRNPLEVWRSLEAQWRSGKTDGLDLPQAAALALWERCVRNSLEFAAGRPTLVTGYATLLADPRGWSEVGAEFLRLIGQEPRPEAAAEVSSFVDATLRHAVNDASDLAAEELVSPAQAELAAILERLEGVHDRLVVPALPPETPWVEPLLAGRREALVAARAAADVDAPRNGR